MTAAPNIVALGAGRMGRGIAQMFAYAGHEVTIIDFKERKKEESIKLLKEAKAEIKENLEFLVSLEVIKTSDIPPILDRIHGIPLIETGEYLKNADYIFEGVPELLDSKEDAISRASALASEQAIIASTTSTMLVTQLMKFSSKPENFLNAHFLNPAYLVPLVEVSPSENINQKQQKKFMALLESIGKVPVICKASPGYIIPRLQSLMMSEAVRMVEEGVASVEDIDRAVRTGFGIRYATMGPIEFIDWGGLDILHYANAYLSEKIDKRFKAPKIIEKMMKKGHLGMNHGKGFYDFENMDVEAYKRSKLSTFVKLLEHLDLLPKKG